MQLDNNKKNSLPNEIIQESNLYKHKNYQNQTQKKNFTFMKNKKIEEPLYVMTVELEKGKNESIKIFPSSKPEELAYEFCKNHNLDFSSLSYLTEEISNLFKKFPNDKKDKILENEPIEEVDEDEYIHGIEKKISNNIVNQQLNNDNLSNNNIIDNNLINDNQNLNNMDLYTNNKSDDEKIDFSGTKGRIDTIEEFNDFEKDIIKEDDNGGSINLDLELEKENENYQSNLNNDYENNENKNYNINNDNDNKKFNSNKEKNDINNNNYIINNNFNKKILKNKQSDKEKEKNDSFNKKKKTDLLNENFDFYNSRKKVISYEQFFDNFKKNLVTHPNFFKKKATLKNSNKLNKDYKSFNLDIKRIPQNYSNISKTDYNIINPNNNNLFIKTFSENTNNIKDKLKETFNKSKKMNKSLFVQNNKDIFLNQKTNFEKFFSTCAALDEVYQNRINDESIFLSKLNSPNQINLNKKKLSLNELSENEDNSSKKNFKKSLSSNHKKSNKGLFSNISKSERNNNPILKNRKSKYKFENDNYKNISFSPSINSSGLNQKSKVLNEKGMITSPNKDIKYRKRNSYILLKNINFSPNKKIKDKKGYFYNKRKVIKNDNKDNIINNSDKIDNFDKENLLKKIFLVLDPENKGYADLKSSNTQKIPLQVIIILSPIFNNSKNKNKISMNEFISIGNVLLNKIPFEDKRTLFEFSSKL